MQATKEKFIGTWHLVSCDQTNEDGSVSYPWGKDVTGYIIYTPDNMMAVQIMRRERKLFKSSDWLLASKEECADLPNDYNAYFGTYEIDEEKQVVIHHIQGHLVPNMIGKDNIRKYFFDKNRLTLSVVNGPKRDLIWEKVK